MTPAQRLWLEEALRLVRSAKTRLSGHDHEEPAPDQVSAAIRELINAATEIQDALEVSE